MKLSKNIRIVILLSTVAGLIAQFLSYYFDFNYAYRDSIFRMEAARRFFDSLNPGVIEQIGTVWLPVPNLILMPLASVDYLWFTGLAGSIVNFIAFVICSVAIFLIINYITKNKTASYIGLFVFILNPNILYFQTTAMTEQLYITFTTLSILFLIKWQLEIESDTVQKSRNKNLIYSGIFIALACGSRYDGWPVAFFLSLFVLIYSFGKKERYKRTFILFTIFPALMIIFWFLHNLFQYGDALEFARGQFSTHHQLKYFEEAGRLQTKHNLPLSLKTGFSSMLCYSGIVFTITSLAGFIFYGSKNKLSYKNFLPYFLVFSFPVTVILLYIGQIIIELPDSEPPGYFNSRYGLYSVSGIAFFTGYLFYQLLNKKLLNNTLMIFLTSVLFIIQFSLIIINPYRNFPAREEGLLNYSEANNKFGYFLRDNYDGGNILYDNVVFALQPWTKIYMNERITYHTFIIGEKALKKPSEYARWIMYYTKAENDRIYKAVLNNPDFINNFERIYEYRGIEIYKRKF